MVLILDPDRLSQGNSTAVTDGVWGAPTGFQVTITSAGTNIPAIDAGDYFEIRDHSNPANNGLYLEDGGSPTTGSVTATKQTGTAPLAAASEAISWLGDNAAADNYKTVHFDTGAKELWLFVQGNLSNDGVNRQAIYSFEKEEWKTDATLIPFPFPEVAIDADAGKYEMGNDGTNNNGWVMKNDVSRKLIRSAGWKEIDSSGVLQREYAGVASLGEFEDEVNDNAYYQFGSDNTDTGAAVDFDFAGPVNEPILTYDNNVPVDGVTGFAITTNDAIARNDGGNWVTDGFQVGGRVEIQAAENVANNGTYKLLTVGTGVDGTITVGTLASPTATEGFDFVDGGGGNDSLVRNDGGSWLEEGYHVSGTLEVRNATTVANDGTYTPLVVTASTIEVATASFTADTDDNAANFGPLVNNAADNELTGAVDNRNAVTLRLRVRDGDPNGKTFSQANLADAGETILSNRLFKFPLGNATDLKVSETDAIIDVNPPYTEIQVRHFDEPYDIDIDTTGVPRAFGILVDVGTYSMPNGVSATSTLLTSADLSGITLGDYTGGDLIIHEGTDKGTHTISGTPVDNAGTLEVTVTVALTASETNLSFSLQRTSPVVATAEEIYEKVQRELRKNTDIDQTTGVNIGRTADELLIFEGDVLRAGTKTPRNPNGGGSGVVIFGFDSNDTNRLSFQDNTDTRRTFPFVAAGSISFNANLVNDTDPEFWMFFEYTTRTAVSDLAVSGASGSDASIDSAGANLPVLTQFDYVNILNATNPENNGIWLVTDATPTASQFDATKVDRAAVVNETAFAGTVDENPVNSPDGLIVQDNSATDIAGAVPGATRPFDFDYDNNVQGGRTAATDAAIVIRAIGLETGQFVETTGIITRNVGLAFSVVSAVERNYSNP